MKKFILFFSVFVIFLNAEEKIYRAKKKYEVKTVDIVLKDTERNAEIPLRIKYPLTAGKFPVIIFSHGLGGSNRGYFTKTDYWASSGYITIQPTHNDSLTYGGEFVRMKDRLKDWFTSNEFLTERVKDIEKILNSLDKIADTIPQLKGKIDKNKIGLGGHSAGALTSQVIGGVKVKKNGKLFNLKDERVKAVLLMSPQGISRYYGLEKNSWENFSLPCMMMTGTYDKGPMGENYIWRKSAFLYSPSGEKFFVVFKGANHFSFSCDVNKVWYGFCDKNQQIYSKYINMLSLAFWDAYLKGKKEAKSFLLSPSLSSYSSIFTIQHRYLKNLVQKGK